MYLAKNPPSAAINIDHYYMDFKSLAGADIYKCGYASNLDAFPDLVIAPLTATIVHNSTIYTQELTTYTITAITTTDLPAGGSFQFSF